jgi:HK97 family phage prohead protease
VSYVIVDLDGTLILEGEEPNQPLIDHLNEEVMSGEAELLIVSARKIERLQETRAWLQENKVAGVEAVYLNDFEGSAFATGLAFKEYKYGLLKEQYGDELMMSIDNDPAVRAMAEKLGITGHSPEEHLAMEYKAVHTDPPAPKSDQITGSDENAPGSASGKLGDIKLSDATEKGLQTKSDDHNAAMKEADRPSWTRVRVDALRAVYRRGSGAYSVSHRPGTTREQWSMARVNAFLYLARTGAPENAAYVSDNDLLNPDHPRYAEDKSRAADYEQRAVYEVPMYIRDAARKGLEFYADGLAGDGLQPETVSDARELAAGRADSDKVLRTAAWIRRHRGDWEGVPQNSDSDNADFPGPGAVAGFLWGVETSDPEATDRVLSWADALIAAEDREIVDMKEKETRSVPMGEFRLAEAGADGQRTFTGYASIWNSASAGLPFEEKIAPNAFKRSLARASAGQKIIAFLFGHDETRALATTASGRLQLTEDETGLRVEAKLDPADPDAAKVISMLTHESAAAGMSFGFQKVQDAWDGNNRTIKEANLFEVSILAAGGQTPAYPATLGLTAIRQVTAPKIGVDAEALLATLESVKAGRELSSEEVAVIDAVRSKLAPKPVGIDPSIASALLTISAAEGDAL